MRERAQRAIAECKLIAGFTEEPGRTTRRFLTAPIHEVHAHLRARMESMGMTVRVDAAGNLRGLWQPEGARGKRLLLGSHVDTVPNAGAFDGVLGVALALEWLDLARELALPLAIEVIAFSEEEGVRFGVPFIGSRAAAASFDRKMLALEDVHGVRMDAAIRAFGLDPEKIGEAVLDENVLGFIEMHIEQGPVLEAESLPLAVVTAIAGQTRLALRFTGQANHAGTTPMHLRRDALAAAAEWIAAVESRVKEAAADKYSGLVATVGKIEVEPNAGNVIAGAAGVSLDVRHISNRVRGGWVANLIDAARTIADRRGIQLEWAQKSDEPAVKLDRELTARLLSAVETAGFPAKRMHSGAGHDAMVMAARVPTTMLFLRSPGGISHHPAEAVLEEDVEAALLVGRKFLEQLAADVG
jgi:allantoate deiminase